MNLYIKTIISAALISIMCVLTYNFAFDSDKVEKLTTVIGDQPSEKIVVDIYCRHGYVPNKAIVFTHGSVPNGRNEQFYPKMYKQLAKKGYLIISYDLRGYGESLKHAEIKSSEEIDFLADAKRVIDFAKAFPYIEETIVMGHSCGGDVAFAAATEDEDIRQIILLSSAYHNYYRENKQGKMHYLDNKFNNVMKIPLTFQDADRIINELTVWNRLPLHENKRVLIINVDEDHQIQLNRAKRFAELLEVEVKRVVLKGVGHFFKKPAPDIHSFDHKKIHAMSTIIDEWIQQS